MTEASVRSALVKKLRRYKDWTVLRHEDHYTSGIPDISVTGNKITSWWECKLRHGSEQLPTKGIQQFLVEQLAEHGYAAYIVYHEQPPQVFIFIPEQFPDIAYAISPPGLDHDWVVRYIRQVHRLPS